MAALTLILFMLWVLAFSLHLLGVYTCRKHFRCAPIAPDTPYRLIPVTILKPLKGIDSGLKENLQSFFELDYPVYEIFFSVADAHDPAVPVVSRLMNLHPEVRARLFVGETPVGRNPKINNLIKSYAEASHPWILISDSNIRVDPSYLKKLVSQIGAETGMITSVVLGTGAEGMGGELESVHLNTFYAKAMVLASAVNKDCVVGKSMLFRKSSAERFGGLAALGGYLAEDYMAGEAMKHLGLKVATAWEAVPQHIGAYTLEDYWKRHARWGRIRKAQAPLAFLLEPLGSALVPGLLCAWTTHSLFGLSGVETLAAHTLIWAVFDFSIMDYVGARIRLNTVFAWLVREALAVPLWIQILSGNTVMWRGVRYRLKMGGLLVEQSTG